MGIYLSQIMLFKLKLSSINLSIAIIKHSTRVIAKTDKTNSLFPSLTFIYLKEKQYDTIIIVNEKGTNRIKKYVYGWSDVRRLDTSITN